jgi:antitoxin CptB
MQERLKRMRMRSWRRGTKEMDLVLGPYADAHLEAMDPAALDEFEAILAEQDQDLMSWIVGQKEPPVAHKALITRLLSFAESRKGRI